MFVGMIAGPGKLMTIDPFNGTDSGGGASGFILLEDSSYLLLEDNSSRFPLEGS